MGSRADDKLREIEQLRASLGSKLEEIENRLPLAGMGKKVAAAIAGSSVAGSALAFGFKRLRRGKRKTAKRDKHRAVTMPSAVTVNVFPKGAAWLAAAGLAGWAGIKVYEALKRPSNGAEDGSFRPAVVTPMPETGRGSGN